MGITSQSIDIRPGDIVSQAGDNRMHNAHLPGNLRVVRFYAEYIRGLTLSGTKTHVKQRFLPLTPLLMVSDDLWSPVLPA